jgi:hypothetical protein
LIEFKPEYDKQNRIGYLVVLFLSVISVYLFVDSGYKEFKLLGFPPLMIAYLIIYTRYIVIKNIIFDDYIHVKRFIWREVVIYYDNIEHITFASLKAGRKTILFQGIINKDELLKILNEKVTEGKINIDNAKNQKVATKQYINMNFGAILFLVLFIIQGIAYLLPYHLINSGIDGFIIWLIICLIYKLIIDKKIG